MSSASITSTDITSSLSKVERSWLDIVDSECSSTTVSSNGLATKLLSIDSKDNSDRKIKPESNTVKIKKTKLISTKILDFKWDKESFLGKKQTSTQNNSNTSSLAKKEDDDIEIVMDSLRCENVEIKSLDSPDNFIKSTDCDILMDEQRDQDLDNLSASAGSSFVTSSQESSTSEAVISSLNKFSSTKSVRKYQLYILYVCILTELFFCPSFIAEYSQFCLFLMICFYNNCLYPRKILFIHY